MPHLRSKLIHLAHAHPEFRKELLPLLMSVQFPSPLRIKGVTLVAGSKNMKAISESYAAAAAITGFSREENQARDSHREAALAAARLVEDTAEVNDQFAARAIGEAAIEDAHRNLRLTHANFKLPQTAAVIRRAARKAAGLSDKAHDRADARADRTFGDR